MWPFGSKSKEKPGDSKEKEAPGKFLSDGPMGAGKSKRDYDKYVMETQSDGGTPKPFKEWREGK
jgi:hypothetical protein